MIAAPLFLALAFSANGLQPDAAAVVSIRVDTSVSAKTCAPMFDTAWRQAEPSQAIEGEQIVRVRFDQQDGTFDSVLSFADGTTRRLSEASTTCTSLARATAFTLRMALNQPQVEAKVPLDPNADRVVSPSSGIRSPGASPSSPLSIASHEVSLTSGVSIGLVGAPTWVMQASYATRLIGPLKPSVSLGWHLPQTVAPLRKPDQRSSRVLLHLGASGCYEPLREPLVLGVCGELMVGTMLNQPKSTTERVMNSTLWVAAAAGLEAALPIGRAFSLLMKAQLVMPLTGMGLIQLAISDSVSVQNIGGIVSLGIAWDPS